MPNKLPRITNAQRAGFCGLIIAGLSFADACSVMDLSQQRVHGVLPENWLNPLPNRPYKSWRGEVLELMRQAYIDPSQNVPDIAKRHGTSVTYVYRLASLHKWPSRTAATALPPMTKEQRKLYEKLRDGGIPRPIALVEAFR